MKRRRFLHHAARATAFTAFSAGFPELRAAELGSPSTSEAAAIRALAEGFLKEHGIHGMAIAFGRGGSPGFEAGYGFADAEEREAVTGEHRFRIASLSKPITATAVMMSVEKGLLKLGDRVFGPGSILGDAYGSALPEPVRTITVDHLLTHTCGGWSNRSNDPMFRNTAMKHEALITSTLANDPLTDPPGTTYAYSNFGYCVLGRILEKVTKLPYETLIRQQVLSRCGVTGMAIAGNTLAGRAAKEVIYHDENPERPYSMPVARMDAHGGWIATAGDLVRFASQLPELLRTDSLRTMTTPGPGRSYARGWSVNEVPNWWHSGSLPGSSSIMVHTAKGICWAGLLNGRTEDLGPALDRLMWKIGREVKSWDLQGQGQTP